MLNSIITYSERIFVSSEQKIVNSLSDKQKNILLIASAALAFLAACYLAYQRYNSYQKTIVEIDLKADDIVNDELDEEPIAITS